MNRKAKGGFSLKAKGGFTLIELLVVIAIIAVLAAILFPVFLRAKRSALKSTCLSNFKQVGIAMLLYVDDNDGRYPAENQDNLPPGFASDDFSPAKYPRMSHTAVGVIWTIKPYIKSPQFWQCPLGAKWKIETPNTYLYPRGVSINTPSWGMVGRIKGLGIGGEVYTNYSAFALTRQHPPMRHDLASGGLANDLMCAMGKTPEQFRQDCKSQGYQPWMFHDSYSAYGYEFIPHGGIGGVYYDGHVRFVRDPRSKD